jgi:outer membrane receptor protein involved in Fe transport
MAIRHYCIMSAAAIAASLASPANAQENTSQEASEAGDDIIVTGVLAAQSIEKAPIAITALDEDDIAQQSPVSTADLLKAVPGVFVNSAIGEIRNVIYSRGVSANSLEAASGYYYVSLQEDGVPVEPILSDNFGPDYFSRADIMLSRIEALRGGTAAITGPNAPGGIFNFISRTGKSDPGQEIRVKAGLEADGKNPYYRADFYTGGALSDGGLYYAIGGFYRKSDGQRDAGYALNKGGQIRGNLLYDYGNGSVLFGLKYLNDRNAFYEFMPAFNFNDPKLASGYTNISSVLPSSGARAYTSPFTTGDSWDPSNLVQSKAFSVNLDWKHDLSDNIRIQNKWNWSRNRSNWNTAAVVSSTTLTDIGSLNTLGVVSGNAPVGTLTFRTQGSAASAATVFVNLANLASGTAFTVTSNNLPNQNILAKGVQTMLAFAPEYESQGWQNQFTLSGEIDQFSFAAGGYYQDHKIYSRTNSAGFGFMTLEPQPEFLDITYAPIFPAGIAGRTYNVTGPGGLANHGVFADGYDGDQRQYSLFASGQFSPVNALTIDGGIRYENVRYNALNITMLAYSGNAFTSGGRDGNALTLYDNITPTIGTPTTTQRSYDFFNFSGSIAYDVSDSFQAYVRYTNGKKAPDFNLIRQIDTPTEIATQFPKAQSIEQLEMGLKFNAPGVRIQLYPFYSKLSNVASLQTFIDNNNQAYSPDPSFGQNKAYGIELQANVEIVATLNLDAAITVQKATSSGFSTWQANTSVRTDDVLVVIPKGDADNNPNLIVRTTATWNPVEPLAFFGTVSYLGKRPANRFNAFDLPGFATVDLGASFSLTDTFQLQAAVTNVFDSYGIMSWSRSGSLLASLDRQSLTPAEVAATGDKGLLQVIPTAARAFYLTGTLKF